MINPGLETPVLFIVFNRLDTTKRVFGEIKKARPKKLFIAADGPRNKPERRKTDVVRKYILKNIDWNCEVKTLFRGKNLGCGIAVSSAINWFFENVEYGIILEDDCLPGQDFFIFCQQMLQKHENNKKIMHISGDTFIDNKFLKYSYYFTKRPFIWGWATWRRAWKEYSFENYKKISHKKIKIKISNFTERKLFARRLSEFKRSGASSWDLQWWWTILNREGLCICPKVNLIENIGLSEENATHTHENFWDKLFLNRKRKNIRFPLRHPPKAKEDKCRDFSITIKDICRSSLKKIF